MLRMRDVNAGTYGNTLSLLPPCSVPSPAPSVILMNKTMAVAQKTHAAKDRQLRQTLACPVAFSHPGHTPAGSFHDLKTLPAGKMIMDLR